MAEIFRPPDLGFLYAIAELRRDVDALKYFSRQQPRAFVSATIANNQVIADGSGTALDIDAATFDPLSLVSTGSDTITTPSEGVYVAVVSVPLTISFAPISVTLNINNTTAGTTIASTNTGTSTDGEAITPAAVFVGVIAASAALQARCISTVNAACQTHGSVDPTFSLYRLGDSP